MAEVFRKKALERRASPDHLDDYIKVSNPSVWFVLGAIIVFLAGLCIWGFFGRIDDVQKGVVTVSQGQAICYLDQSSASHLDPGDAVVVGGVSGTVVSVDSTTVPVTALSSQEQAVLSKASWAAKATVSIDLPDGTYEADVTVVSTDPVALLFNTKS